jgi:hypothetical protein
MSEVLSQIWKKGISILSSLNIWLMVRFIILNSDATVQFSENIWQLPRK